MTDLSMRVAELYGEAIKIKIQDQINANSRQMNPLPEYDDLYITCLEQNNGLEEAIKFVDQIDLAAIVASVTAEGERREQLKAEARERLSKLPEIKVEVGEVVFVESQPVAWDVVYRAICMTVDACKQVSGQHSAIDQMVNKVQIANDAIGADTTGAPPKPYIPPGHKLVPVEPTEEMLVFGQEAWAHARRGRNAIEDCVEATDVYRAMIAAAPEYKEG